MFREILTTNERRLTLELPAELVGKRIEVLAFELPAIPTPAPAPEISEEEVERRRAKIREITAGHLVDLRDFKFDRDEANNYDRD